MESNFVGIKEVGVFSKEYFFVIFIFHWDYYIHKDNKMSFLQFAYILYMYVENPHCLSEGSNRKPYYNSTSSSGWPYIIKI